MNKIKITQTRLKSHEQSCTTAKRATSTTLHYLLQQGFHNALLQAMRHQSYETIDKVMLTTTTNCLTNVINKKSHGLECNFGNNCMAT